MLNNSSMDLAGSDKIIGGHWGRALGAKLMAKYSYPHLNGQLTELQVAERALNIFSQLSYELGSSLDIHETLLRLQNIITHELAPLCSVWWFDGDGYLREISRQASESHLGELILDYHVECGPHHVAKSGVPEFHPHLREANILKNLPNGLSSYLAVPMRSGNQIVGVICLFKNLGSFHIEDLVIAQEISNRAAVSLQNAYHFANLKKVQLDMEKAKQQAEQSNQAKSLFLANMSHEIRTPLTAIMGFADLMLTDLENKEQLGQWAERIIANGIHLQQIIDEILDLSRVEAGRMELDLQVVDLSSLLKEVVISVTPQAIQKRNNLRVIFCTPIPTQVEVDPVRLKQILINVINNAVKFTDSGDVTVEVRYNVEKKKLVCFVRDSGIGMTMEQSKKLFQTFSQADPTHKTKYGGSGLGLVLSQKICQMLGGDLTLEYSEPGSGSVFKMEIQAFTSDSAEMLPANFEFFSSEAAHSRYYIKEHSLERVKVLLADPDLDSQKLFSLIFERSGVLLEKVMTSAEVFHRVEHTKYDVVILDLGMPLMNGHEICKRLRHQGFDGSVVAVSTQSSKDEYTKSLLFGFDAYLSKPLSRIRVMQGLSQVIEKKRI